MSILTGFGNGEAATLPCALSKEGGMANSNESESAPLIILFSRKGKNYRMRVARVHVHPGERDQLDARQERSGGAER